MEFLPAGGVQITGFDRFSDGVQMSSFVRFSGALQLLPAGQRQGLIVYPRTILGTKRNKALSRQTRRFAAFGRWRFLLRAAICGHMYGFGLSETQVLSGSLTA